MKQSEISKLIVTAAAVFCVIKVTQPLSERWAPTVESGLRVSESNRRALASPEYKTTLSRCPDKEIPGDLYKGQDGEDKHVLSWFGGTPVCGGTYIEMGGYDGMTFSNSYVFNKALDWKGVLVEASPQSYKTLVRNRPNEIATVNAGACGLERDLHWVSTDSNRNINGFLEFSAKSFQEQWWTPDVIAKAQVVKCRTLQNILLETVGESFFFDFFSLDVEGAELEALTTLDFSKVGFGIIFVEADPHNPMKNLAVRTLLERNGYTFVEDKERSHWFINKEFDVIYKDIVY